MCGRLILVPIFSHTEPVDIGSGPTNTTGCGCLTIRGDGRLSIMAAGFMIHFTGGCGCRVMTGHPDGFPGEPEGITMDGLLLARGLV